MNGPPGPSEQVEALWNLGHELGAARGEPLLDHVECRELVRRGVTVGKAMTAATVIDWAALHRDLADVYERHGRPDDARVHRQLAFIIEAFRATDEAWESHLAEALALARANSQ